MAVRLPSTHAPRALVVAALVAVLLLAGAHAHTSAQPRPSFASHIAQLSEPGGYFDTDNLISNERSYLHVVPELHGAGVHGGAYIGVGPDQNFSYIAQVRPTIAFILDVRRDNLLLHLLVKALFELSSTRIDYLALMFGRPAPDHLDEWRGASIDRILASITGANADARSIEALRHRVDEVIKGFGVPLTAEDFATIDRFHRTFIDEQLSLRFQSTGRRPRSYYPTYRDLILESDRQGHQWSYLASEDDFQFVRALERRDGIIPVVGNLAGSSALAAIGRLMDGRGDRLSAFYASNVEFYLYSEGSFGRFVENLRRLPHTSRSVIIRSVFGAQFAVMPPGYASASLLQPVEQLINGYALGRYQSYRDLFGQ